LWIIKPRYSFIEETANPMILFDRFQFRNLLIAQIKGLRAPRIKMPSPSGFGLAIGVVEIKAPLKGYFKFF